MKNKIDEYEVKDKLYTTRMCEAQHKGYPCNSCFHTSVEIDAGDKLKEDVHEYWLAVLGYRGDYPELKGYKEHLLTELIEIL